MLSPRCTAVFADAGVNHDTIRNAMLGFGAIADRSVPRPLAACVPVVLGSDYGPPDTVSILLKLVRPR